MIRRTALATVAGGLLCTSRAFAQSPSQARKSLRIGGLPLDADGELWYGQENGMFGRAGLDVAITNVSNGAAIIGAIIGGTLDLGYSNVVSIAEAYKRGVPVTIVAPAATYSSAAPTSGLIVPPTSPIQTGRDCNGKIFGINGVKNINQFACQAWIDRTGGDAKTVKFVELPFSEMSPALAAGRIDVALVAEPLLAAAKKTSRVIGDPFSAVAPHFLIAAYFTTTTFAKANSDTIKRFASVLRDVAAWSNAHHAETAPVLARITGMDVNVINGMHRTQYATSFTPDEYQPGLDVTTKYGGMDPVSARDLVWVG